MLQEQTCLVKPIGPARNGWIVGSDNHGDPVMLVPSGDRPGKYRKHGWTGEYEFENKGEGYHIKPHPLSSTSDDADEFNPDLWSPVHGTDATPGDFDNQVRIAKLLLNQHQNLVFVNGDFYEFQGSSYRRKPKEEVEAEVLALLEKDLEFQFEKDSDYEESSMPYGFSATKRKEENRRKINRNLVVNVVGVIQSLAYREVSLNAPTWLPQKDGFEPNVIAVMRNCILCRETNGNLRALPLTPQLFAAHSLNFDYDPQVTCSTWIEFLTSIWGEGSDCIEALCEWFGYLVSGGTEQQKILALIGEKRGGKGTIARVLEGLIGRENN